MTYCVGMLLDAGVVMLSDSRTNAGVDNISSFRKVTVFEHPGDRVLVIMSAGNLAASQAVISILRDAIKAGGDEPSLLNAPNMFEAARRMGEAIREVHRRDAAALEDFKLEFNISFVLGGQIAGEGPRLFNVYAAGNFVEATPETPYFQVGELKYGKPIIDRVITRHSSIEQAVKCGLVSMDSTIRSNLSVGLPLDLIVVRSGELRIGRHMVIDADNEYFRSIRSRWSEALKHAFAALPEPDGL
ncbi:MAG: proteasome-type protease [Gammaproteobacteria bacterium]|nr:proteasome-type protease [Gammaproteobacteria bacterium]